MGLAAGLTTERVAVPAPTILRQRFPAVVRQGFHESVDGDHIGPCASNGSPAFNDLVITPVVHVPWIVQLRYLEQAVRTNAAGNEMGLVLLDPHEMLLPKAGGVTRDLTILPPRMRRVQGACCSTGSRGRPARRAVPVTCPQHVSTGGAWLSRRRRTSCCFCRVGHLNAAWLGVVVLCARGTRPLRRASLVVPLLH
jgi:hypothetical protein